jgi:magnesium-transporting ATPase (P-type)
MNQWHSQEKQHLISQLGVNPEKGLTIQEAAQRLAKYGRNSTVQQREIRFWSIFREEVTDLMFGHIFLG